MAAQAKGAGGGRRKSGASAPRTGEDEAPRVDAVLASLEAVVDELEGGELPLEQALARFETGVRLARDGAALLDAMERRVEILLADDAGGTGGPEALAPFEAADADEVDGDDDI